MDRLDGGGEPILVSFVHVQALEHVKEEKLEWMRTEGYVRGRNGPGTQQGLEERREEARALRLG